jgi:precorrin-4 methylase
MTKRHISTRQIVQEFEQAGHVSVIRFGADGKRIGTYSGLTLNAAYREMIDAVNRGIRIVVVKSGDVKSDMYSTYEEALAAENKVEQPRNFGARY